MAKHFLDYTGLQHFKEKIYAELVPVSGLTATIDSTYKNTPTVTVTNYKYWYICPRNSEIIP